MTISTSTSAIDVDSSRNGYRWLSVLRSRRSVGVVSVFVALMLAWQFLLPVIGMPSYVVPTLEATVNALFDPRALPIYLENAGSTLQVVFIGLGVGVGLGIAGALALARFPTLYAIVFPYVVAIESLPKVAIAPLFVIWFGFGIESKVVVVALLAVFPVLVSTIHGLKNVDPDFVDLFLAAGATHGQVRRKLLIPAALPSLFSGLELAVAASMIGAIVAEFVGAQRGLGVLVLQAQARMDTAAVFALLIILSALGIALNVSVRLLRRKIVFWMPGEK